jgi:hypothetical protein
MPVMWPVKWSVSPTTMVAGRPVATWAATLTGVGLGTLSGAVIVKASVREALLSEAESPARETVVRRRYWPAGRLAGMTKERSEEEVAAAREVSAKETLAEPMTVKLSEASTRA